MRYEWQGRARGNRPHPRLGDLGIGKPTLGEETTNIEGYTDAKAALIRGLSAPVAGAGTKLRTH